MRQVTATSAEHADSLMRWWRDAGVEEWASEAPRRWIGAPATAAALPAAAVAGAAVEAPLPASLPAFIDWLMDSGDVPEAGPPARRVRPSGAPGGLMILTDMPELADVEAGHLLSGEIGALFDKMLKALGATRTSTYVASLCPGRPASGRIGEAAFEQLAELARHHVALAAPERLWLLGGAASRALLGIDDLAAHGKLHIVNLDDAKLAAIATAHPRLLLRDPERKHRRRVWANMQLLNNGADQA